MKQCDALVIGCGYLGGRVAAAWRASGLAVAVTTRSAVRAEELRAAGFTPIVCDVLSPASLQQLPIAPKVLHAVGYDRSGSHSLRDVYVTGLQNVLAALQNQGWDAETRKFVHISSTSVYGQSNGEIVDETSETIPQRDNGQVVLDAEQAIRDSRCGGIILRLAGIYGPGRLLARIQQARQAFPVAGNPDAWLNLIHVADAAAAVLAAAQSTLVDETFLVSDDQPIRRREYYETLAKLLGTGPPDFQPDLADPKGDRGLNKRCSNTRLHQHLLPELQFPTIATGLPDALSDL